MGQLSGPAPAEWLQSTDFCDGVSLLLLPEVPKFPAPAPSPSPGPRPVPPRGHWRGSFPRRSQELTREGWD